MGYFINDFTIEEILDRADIVSIVSEYVDLKKVGSNYKGLCPFHSEKTPSFSVSENKKIYKCFGCGEGGNVINFVMKMEGLSFPEACKKLADRYGIEILEKSYEKKDDKRDLMYEMNKKVAIHYMKNLRNSKPAINYLIKRKINIETLNKFGIGYSKDSWDDIVKLLKAYGYDLELAQKCGLVKKRSDGGYYDFFRNRIMFPIISPNSKVLGFGARTLGNDNPKYLNTQDTKIYNKSYNLYGLNMIEKNSSIDYIILVEGYMDVVSLSASGVKNVVASLGTSLTTGQIGILKKYTKNLYICYDGDSAGINATIRALNLIIASDWNAKVIQMPKGVDPDEFIKKEGLLKFEAKMKDASDGYNFLIQKYKEGKNLDSVDEKAELIRYVGSLIKKIKSPIERELKIQNLASEFDISADSIKAELYRGNQKEEIDKPKGNQKTDKNHKESKTLVEILRLMLENREVAFKFEKNLDAKLITDSNTKEVYNSIIENWKNEDSLSKLELLDYLKSNNILEDNLYEELRNDEFLNENLENAAEELLGKISKKEKVFAQNKILRRIKELEKIKNKSDSQRRELLDLVNKLNNINSNTTGGRM